MKKKLAIETKEELIESLKKVKTEKDRKWIYNLIAWALEKQEEVSYTKFQIRINSAIHYATGRYKEYWDNPKNKAQHKLQMEKLRAKNKVKYEAMSKKYHTELKVAHELYRKGKLSENSSKLIAKEMKKRKVQGGKK